jgi:hypothetical protein
VFHARKESKNLQLFGSPEAERPDGIFWCRKEKDTGMSRKEIFWDNIYWIHLTQVRNQLGTIVNTVKIASYMKYSKFLEQPSDW